MTFAACVTWDNKGNIGLYGGAGPGIGFDFSLGVEYANSSSYNSEFNINDLNGPGASTNIAVGPLELGFGGNAEPGASHPFVKTGSNYNTTTY